MFDSDSEEAKGEAVEMGPQESEILADTLLGESSKDVRIMPDYFTMLWNKDYCTFLAKAGEVGKPLRFVWGGQNQQSRFGFFGVRPGDFIFPVFISGGVLHVAARMQVAEAVTRKDYVEAHPEDGHLINHFCASEVLIGRDGTPIDFQRVLPLGSLSRFEFRSAKSERKLKHLHEGKLTGVIDFQGVYHLTQATADDMNALFQSETVAV